MNTSNLKLMDKQTTQMPRRYFGLHMAEGVAEYKEKDGSFRIFINESTIKDMNPTFEGRPVFVNHITDDFKPEDFNEADGVVVKSFYNEMDGKNWVEFMVTSDKGHQAIQQGWKLSNAYFQKEHGPRGEWHGVSFDKEIKKGEYEHLAIVKNPRYSESVIYTPEQFKEYNERKRAEIKKLSNEKEKIKETPSMFKMFKREKIENAADLENTMVTLAGKDITIAEVLSAHEKILNMNGYANGDHFVKAGDEEMSVNDMAKGYMEMKEKMKNMVEKPKDEEEDKKKENEETDEAGKDDLEKEKKDMKAENSKSKGNFDKLKNAGNDVSQKPQVAELQVQKLQRGKERY